MSAEETFKWKWLLMLNFQFLLRAEEDLLNWVSVRRRRFALFCFRIIYLHLFLCSWNVKWNKTQERASKIPILTELKLPKRSKKWTNSTHKAQKPATAFQLPLGCIPRLAVVNFINWLRHRVLSSQEQQRRKMTIFRSFLLCCFLSPTLSAASVVFSTFQPSKSAQGNLLTISRM